MDFLSLQGSPHFFGIGAGEKIELTYFIFVFASPDV